MNQAVPPRRWIKLPLNIVAICTPKSAPCRHGACPGSSIETVGEKDPDDIGYQMPIVKIVPDENLERHT